MAFEAPRKEEIQRFIADERAAPEMVACAERLGSYLQQQNVTSSQIRNAYGNLKKLEMNGWGPQTQRHLVLLKPRLAYAAGRHGGGLKDLKQVLERAIDAVCDQDSFARFCQFFEAILAYHKAYGGRN